MKVMCRSRKIGDWFDIKDIFVCEYKMGSCVTSMILHLKNRGFDYEYRLETV